MVTIEDIAKEAGVSIATVSRVLNGSKKVSDKLRVKVENSIEKHNFIPNMAARSLVRKKSNIVVAMVPDLGNIVITGIVKEFNLVCQERGKSLIICDYDGSNQNAMALLDKMRERQMDGIVFLGQYVDSELIAFLRTMECPVILCGQMGESVESGSNISCACMDIYHIAQDVTRFLLRDGHQRIAYIGGPQRDYMNGEMRLKGFLDAMEEHGLSVPEAYIVQGEFSFENGRLGMQRIYEQSLELPTAVISGGDNITLGILKLLYEVNLKVPDDISLISFDDAISNMVLVPVTSVHMDNRKNAVSVMDEIYRLCDSEMAEGKTIIFEDYRIIRRRSTKKMR